MKMICRLWVAMAIAVFAVGTRSYSQTSNQPVEYLDQGWNESERQWWYAEPQGSRLLPQAWFMALEVATGTERFASPANMLRYGYLENPAGSALPIGFAIDVGFAPDTSTEPWVGLTCAACHTSEMTYKGKRLRIDGAPTLADFETFIEEFGAALKATIENDDKFNRFAAVVLGSRTQQGKNQLRADLQKQVGWYTALLDKNRSSVKYGHGRLDAQGHILNKVSLIIGVPQQLGGYASDAPASYPFLWYTPQHEVTQWNGIVPFNNILPILRNVGQVVGVFASIDVASNPTAYPSSARINGLNSLEEQVKRLRAPLWPEHILPKPSPTSVGASLFKENCARCHTSIDRTTGQPIEQDQRIAQMKKFSEVGTDIWLACNAFIHQSRAGQLAGRDGLKPIDKTALMLTNVVLGIIAFTPPSDPANVTTKSTELGWTYGTQNRARLAPSETKGKVDSETECRQRQDEEATLGYKAGPLNGIWATAPYLHNGSVPTLADLLMPPEQRPTVFSVGGREFDPERVGFKSGPTDGPFEFRVRDASGKVIPGNDNAGHTWGTMFSAEDKAALLEYLKSL